KSEKSGENRGNRLKEGMEGVPQGGTGEFLDVARRVIAFTFLKRVSPVRHGWKKVRRGVSS
ncbi:MAG TPA: hypothetical protein VI282_00025, partial [Verrucomicrobiae bacterium]